MAVTEKLMGAGTFSINFSQEYTPTAIIESIKEWGHIVITPQSVDINSLSDSDILSSARYTGIILNRTLEEGIVSINGQGLELYMGDGSGKGMVIAESNNIGKVRIFDGVTLAEALFNSVTSTGKPYGIMRDETGALQAIQQGSIYQPTDTEGENVLYSGQHFVETALSALKFICEIVNAEYRVNPNGTLDAGPAANLFVGVGSNEPTSVVVKTAYGEDPEYQGVTPQGLRSEFDATDWVSRVDFTGEVGYFDIATDVAGEANLSSNPYKDLHGNALKRVGLVQEPDVPEEHLNSRAQAMLNELSRVKKILNLDLTQYEVSGDMKVGDYVYAFDPDVGFVDTDADAAAESRDKYEVTFRGQTITPAKVRIIGLTFPIIDGMGVYFRDKDGNYTDLTQYINYESGSTQVELGDSIRSLKDDLRFSEFSLSREVAGAFSIPDLPSTPTLQSGTYLDSTGESKGFIRITVSKPTNIDGSQITDGESYKVRYKKLTDNEYSYMSFPFTGVSSETLLLQDLTVGATYQIGVAVVDKSGFKKMSAYDGTGENLYTDSSSINPSYTTNARIEIEKDGQAPSQPKQATIATGPLRVQITHYLGKAGTDSGGNAYGDFTLEGDLDHLDIHAVTQDGNTETFTVASSNKIGEVKVNSGNLLQEIPVVANLELPDSEDYYFRIVAVDKSGNASDPSAGQAGNATLMEQAYIGDAAITTAKIGEAAITDAKIATATITSAKISDVSADKLTSGTITGGEITVGGVSNTAGYIQSYNYVADTSGWSIFSDGTAEFQDVKIRGELNASDIVTGTLDASNLTVTNLNADSITAGTLDVDRLPTITTSQINFDAGDIGGADSSNIVATINTSSEGLTINAAKLNLSGVLSVTNPSITSGNIGGITISSDYIQSDNYGTSSGADGFRIQSDGNAFFKDVTISGVLNGVTANQPVTLDLPSGGKIRTASSGARVELHQAGSFPSVNFYSSGGTTTSLYDDNSASFVISTTREITLSGTGGIHLADNTLHIGSKQGSFSSAIYIDGDIGGSTDVLRSSGTYAYWGSPPATAGVTALAGQGTISVGPGNTGSLIISNNHSHDAHNHSGTVFTSDNHHNNNSFINSSDVTNNSTVQTGYNHANSAHVANNTINYAIQVHAMDASAHHSANTVPQHDNNEHSEDYTPLSSYNNHLNNLHFSDARLKNDVTDTSFGLDFVNRLRPVDYTWDQLYLDTYYGDGHFDGLKALLTNQQTGFLAQEVKTAVYETNGSNIDFGGFIEVELTDEDRAVKEATGTTDDIHKLDYQQFIPPLVKAVQELSAKIDVLEARIDELEGA